MIINIKVKTNSKISELVQDDKDGYGFVAYLQSSPQDGRANEELIKLVKEYFGTTMDQIKIIKGVKNKQKLVEIEED